MSLTSRLLGVLRRERVRNKAILFADIVSSTELYESKGDRDARELVAGRLAVLGGIARRHHGRVLKELGDGILCDFDAPRDAFVSGLDMTGGDSHSLEVRVGIHVGEVIERSRDIFGDAVNTAARIAGVAKPSEVLISSAVLAALPAGSDRLVQPMPPISVKGKQQPLELFAAVRFGQGDGQATMPIIVPAGEENTKVVLELRCSGRTWRCDVAAPRLSLGRQADNDIVVDAERVSRHHARIYVRAGKFVLSDQSANGTWLVPEGGAKLLLRREEMIVHGAGTIFLGVEPNDTDGIAFCVKD